MNIITIIMGRMARTNAAAITTGMMNMSMNTSIITTIIMATTPTRSSRAGA